MAFFDQGRLLRFSGGLDLLRYPRIDFGTKLRYAALVAMVRLGRDWRHLEDLTAEEWLSRVLGRRGFEAFWAELIRRKFGEHAQGLSAAWIWARIKRNACSRRFLLYDRLGYLEGGTGVFVDELVRRLHRAGVCLRLRTRVDRIVVGEDKAVRAIEAGGERLGARTVITPASSSSCRGSSRDPSQPATGNGSNGSRTLGSYAWSSNSRVRSPGVSGRTSWTRQRPRPASSSSPRSRPPLTPVKRPWPTSPPTATYIVPPLWEILPRSSRRQSRVCPDSIHGSGTTGYRAARHSRSATAADMCEELLPHDPVRRDGCEGSVGP